jgi:hypothetical protein
MPCSLAQVRAAVVSMAEPARRLRGPPGCPPDLTGVADICPLCRVELVGVLSAQVDFLSASDWRLPYWRRNCMMMLPLTGKKFAPRRHLDELAPSRLLTNE